MHGLNCGRCHGERGPYLTAYEIAVKHGYEGSEEDWIETIQSVYTARVTAKGAYEWECSVTFEELMARVNLQEVHLLTMEGRTAFCNGYVKNIGSGYIRFQTSPFYDEDVGGYVYEIYELYASDAGTYNLADVYAPGMESITKQMLSGDVQTELDGAVQKSEQATKESYQTQPVGVDEDGQLWVFQPTDIVPATAQPVKTGAMTCEVGIDGEGQLWSEGYKKPGTGIPETDLASDISEKVNKAGLKSLGFRDDGESYTYIGTEIPFTSLDDLIEKISSGVNLRLVITNKNDTYPCVHFHGTGSTARVFFCGPTVIPNGSYGIILDSFELQYNNGLQLTKVYSEQI